VGFVGKEVIRLLAPFGCKILAHDIVEQSDFYRTEGVIQASKEDIFAQADIVSLHVPLESDTKHMVNKTVLRTMQPHAYVINTARGPLIDLDALKEALQSNVIAGAAIDVYDQEPPQDKELLSLENLICTPHIGGNSKEAVISMGMSAVEHLQKQFLS